MSRKKIDNWQEIANIVKIMDDDFISKMDFAENFLKDFNVSGSDDTKVRLGSFKLIALKYFIYLIIMDYEKYVEKN